MDEYTTHNQLLECLVPDVSYIWYYNETTGVSVIADTNSETFDILLYVEFKWVYAFSVSLSCSLTAMDIVHHIERVKIDKNDIPF